MYLILVSFVLLNPQAGLSLFIQPDEIVIENLPLTEKKERPAYMRRIGICRNKPAFFQRTRTERFVFDPNTVSLQELIELGFTTKTAAHYC